MKFFVCRYDVMLKGQVEEQFLSCPQCCGSSHTSEGYPSEVVSQLYNCQLNSQQWSETRTGSIVPLNKSMVRLYLQMYKVY